MGKVLNIIALISILFAIGCSRRASDCKIVDIDLMSLDAEYVNFSKFADSITYINLTDADICPIGNIKNIRILQDSLILILDSKTDEVKMFDTNGKFVSKVGAKGKGHGEYLFPIQIDFDTDKQHILVFDKVMGAVLRYSLSNEFMGLDSIQRADDVVYAGDGKYLAANYNDESDNAGIYLISNGPHTRTKIFGCKGKLAMNKPMEFFKDGDKISIFSRQYENVLLEWQNGELIPQIDFNVAQSPRGNQLSQISKDHRELKKYPDRVEFRNSGRWFYTYFWIGDELRHIFLDKKEDKIEIVRYLKNDIDGIYGTLLPLCLDNSFISVVESEVPDKNPTLQFIHLKQ